MLGVTVDYPVLLVGHRKEGEPAAGTWARIGPTFWLAVATAAIGLCGMAFAAVPGVAQLGLFAVCGLLAAAAATRLVLPPLLVASGIAPVAAGDPALLRRVERWRRLRPLGGVAVLAAALLLVLHPPRWQRDLGALTPIPPAARALDAQLRGELGAPEPGEFAVLRAPTGRGRAGARGAAAAAAGPSGRGGGAVGRRAGRASAAKRRHAARPPRGAARAGGAGPAGRGGPGRAALRRRRLRSLRARRAGRPRHGAAAAGGDRRAAARGPAGGAAAAGRGRLDRPGRPARRARPGPPGGGARGRARAS